MGRGRTVTMHMRAVAGIAFAALAAGATGAAAQVPADASWHTVASRHFRVTYEAGLEPVARHAAAAAERAWAALSVLVAEPPRGAIDIVVADNLDLSNGFATPFPSNRIVIYARPPVDLLELQYTRDWIELVVTHELAHVFHLDVTSGLGRVLRTLFGRVPAPWPFFPAVGVPAWSVEGLAVGVESELTDYGRVHGSYNEMVVRTAALARRLDEFDRLGSSSARWPGGARAYVYGSLFMDYLARRYGVDAARRIVSSTAGALIPPPLWFGNVGRRALDITFRDAYREWEREVVARSDSLAGVLRAQGTTSGEPLTEHRAVAWYPRFSPDGSRIAYAAHDWRTPPQLRVIDAATGAVERSERMNQPAPAAWTRDGSLVTAEVDFIDRFRIYSDLHRIGSDDRQITRGARLEQPDISRAGRVVAVENGNGTNRLVLVDTLSGTIRPLTGHEPGRHYALPRFSPSGDRIAVERWSRSGHDIVVLDTLGSEDVLTDGFGVNAAPAWSPDGRWVLFGSDRSGIPNLYAIDVAAVTRATAPGVRPPTALRQVTNVVTGAFQPDVSADGRWIAFAAYHPDGFRIERMPFDSSAWRTPAATGAAQAVAPRPDYAIADGNALLDSVATALATADTMTGEAHGYSALRSLRPYFWAPFASYDDGREELYLGAFTWGQDLVQRHAWDVAFAIETGSGRTQGLLGYTYRGLPTMPGLGLHPTIGAFVAREWDEFFRSADPDGPYADEREDVAGVALGFTRPRWRVTTGFGVLGERVLRSRYLYNAPPNTVLRDPDEDLWGVRLNAFRAHFVTPPLAISREAGYSLSVAARQRWDSHARTIIEDTVSFVLDGGYRELTTFDAAYLALPLAGFARHVLALRFSGLLRDGPGASLSRIGGASGAGFAISGLASGIGGTSLLLPIRGFERGVRAGTDAWTATAEYRFPLALIDAPLRPFFFDRLSGAVFADAGHAWCDDDFAARFAICTSTAPDDAPLLSAGAEVTLLVSLLGVTAPIRVGAGFPIRGGTDSSPRFYITTGPAF
ncbi:MAG TPA: hypothetical protein VFZ69_08445 [Longimicrobiales bacterium]